MRAKLRECEVNEGEEGGGGIGRAHAKTTRKGGMKKRLDTLGL